MKGAKVFLEELSARLVSEGQFLVRSIPASDVLNKLEAIRERARVKRLRAKRAIAESQIRSGLKGWDFTLEEVTKMWYEREVDAVHGQ